MAVDSVTVAAPFSQRVVWAYPVPGAGPPPAIRGFSTLPVTIPGHLSFAPPNPSAIEPAALVDQTPTWSDVASPAPTPTLSSVQVSPTVITVITGG